MHTLRRMEPTLLQHDVVRTYTVVIDGYLAQFSSLENLPRVLSDALWQFGIAHGKKLPSRVERADIAFSSPAPSPRQRRPYRRRPCWASRYYPSPRRGKRPLFPKAFFGWREKGEPNKRNKNARACIPNKACLGAAVVTKALAL